EVESGVVRKLIFLTDDVADISPVHALKGLTSLSCEGSANGRGKLADLTPLRGLPLTWLSVSLTRVEDLRPLRGTPLKVFLPAFTRVSDLSPLQGMKLEMLYLMGTAVTDLTPLRGMPLTRLDLAWARWVTDLRPTEGMPLEYLNVSDLPVSDLS